METMFDENSYKTIDSADKALSYVRYYTKMAAPFHSELLSNGMPEEEASELADELWERIITGCNTFGVPLTAGAEVVAKRLGMEY